MKSSRHQHGFVLVTSLIFLMVLSMLSIYAVRGSLFDERMASSDRDISMARENAELALRDAERDIQGLRFDGAPNFCSSVPGCVNLRPAGTRPTSLADAGNFWSAAAVDLADISLTNGGVGLALGLQGIYNSQSATACGMAIWSGADWQDGLSRACAGTISVAVPTIPYGTFTGAPFPPTNMSANTMTGMPKPRYLIEAFEPTDLGLQSAAPNKLFFRITAVGFGRGRGSNGARTSVTLQTVYSPL